MKTKSLFIAALVLISAVVSAVGKDAPTSKAGLAIVPVKGSEVFKIIYKSESAGRVKVNLYNAANEVVFTETIASLNGFILPLNFRGLSFGEYTVELIDASGKHIDKVKYSASSSVIRVSKLVADGNKFLLAVANSEGSKLDIKIFNSSNELIHSETKDIVGDFAMVYNVINSKGITFEISDNAGNSQVIKY